MSKHSNGSGPQSPRWSLPVVHEEMLRNALRRGGIRKTVSSEQRAIIQQICSSPEKRTYAPEDFVIAFKLALVEAANDVGLPAGPERTDFLARMVSVCIEEFFRSSPLSDGVTGTSAQENVLESP